MKAWEVKHEFSFLVEVSWPDVLCHNPAKSERQVLPPCSTTPLKRSKILNGTTYLHQVYQGIYMDLDRD